MAIPIAEKQYRCTACSRWFSPRFLWPCCSFVLCFECLDAHDVCEHGAEALGAPKGTVLQ